LTSPPGFLSAAAETSASSDASAAAAATSLGKISREASWIGPNSSQNMLIEWCGKYQINHNPVLANFADIIGLDVSVDEPATVQVQW
jgi:hypothetical protein